MSSFGSETIAVFFTVLLRTLISLPILCARPHDVENIRRSGGLLSQFPVRRRLLLPPVAQQIKQVVVGPMGILQRGEPLSINVWVNEWTGLSTSRR